MYSIKRKLIQKPLPPFLTIDTMVVAAEGIALTCAIFLTWYIMMIVRYKKNIDIDDVTTLRRFK